MDIQSLSVVVPCKCPNNCPFCCSKMDDSQYPNFISNASNTANPDSTVYEEYKKRLRFAKDNGCNTVILTGTGEPLSNIPFLHVFSAYNRSLISPFNWIELQTSGVYLNEDALSELRLIGVNTISLSLSDLFSSRINSDEMKIPTKLRFKIDQLCALIKSYHFNLRISLNLLLWSGGVIEEDFFNTAKDYGADQITFRVLYESGKNTKQDVWIYNHKLNNTEVQKIINYVKQNGTPLELLPFGATKYSIHGLSCVIDDDCMNTKPNNTLKYLILRPNCKLYSKWNDPASLIF